MDLGRDPCSMVKGYLASQPSGSCLRLFEEGERGTGCEGREARVVHVDELTAMADHLGIPYATSGRFARDAMD